VDKTWIPNMPREKREQMYALWKKAVTRSFDWVEEPGSE
jgi:glycerol kinase